MLKEQKLPCCLLLGWSCRGPRKWLLSHPQKEDRASGLLYFLEVVTEVKAALLPSPTPLAPAMCMRSQELGRSNPGQGSTPHALRQAQEHRS